MASILKIDELQGNTAVGDITITGEGTATMRLSHGLVKHWCSLLGFSTISIEDSFNASSATDNGTGYYKVTYTNNMNSTYGFQLSGHQEQAGIGGIGFPRSGTTTNADDGRNALATSSNTVQHQNSDGAYRDQELSLTTVTGDLA